MKHWLGLAALFFCTVANASIYKGKLDIGSNGAESDCRLNANACGMWVAVGTIPLDAASVRGLSS